MAAGISPALLAMSDNDSEEEPETKTASVEAAVKDLLALKAQYKATTGMDWAPGEPAAAAAATAASTTAAAPTQQQSLAASTAAELSAKIAEKRDSIRVLKAAKADKILPLKWPFPEEENLYLEELCQSAGDIMELKSLDTHKMATFLKLASGLQFTLRRNMSFWFSRSAIYLSEFDLESFFYIKKNDCRVQDTSQWENELLKEFQKFAESIREGIVSNNSIKLHKSSLPEFRHMISLVHLYKVVMQLNIAIKKAEEYSTTTKFDRKFMLSVLTIGTAILNIALEYNDQREIQGILKIVSDVRGRLAHLQSLHFRQLYDTFSEYEKEIREIFRCEKLFEEQIDTRCSTSLGDQEWLQSKKDPLSKLCESIMKFVVKLEARIKELLEAQSLMPKQKPGEQKDNDRPKDLGDVILKVLFIIEEKKTARKKRSDNEYIKIAKESATGLCEHHPDKRAEIQRFFDCSEFKVYLSEPSLQTAHGVLFKFCKEFDFKRVVLMRKYATKITERNQRSEEEAQRQRDAATVAERERRRTIFATLTGSDEGTCEFDRQEDVFKCSYPFLQAYFEDTIKALDNLQLIWEQLHNDPLLKLSSQFLICFVGSLFQSLKKVSGEAHGDYSIHWYATEMRNRLFHSSRVHQTLDIAIRRCSLCILRQRQMPQMPTDINTLPLRAGDGATFSDTMDRIRAMSMQDYEISCWDLATFIHIFTQFCKWPQ